MREINLDNITRENLVDYAALAEAFKDYLIDVLGYDEAEATYVVSTDFKNPYETQYIMQEFEGKYAVNGKTYEVLSCHTDFCVCGMWHLAEYPPFEFYMFIDLETLPDTTVGSYKNAQKLYLY